MANDFDTLTAQGPMEQAIRKWDGDVFHGHEPEAWADLRMRAREQDAERERLRAVNAQLLAVLEEATSIAYVEATKRSTDPRRYLPSWYDAALAAIAAAKAGA